MQRNDESSCLFLCYRCHCSRGRWQLIGSPWLLSRIRIRVDRRLLTIVWAPCCRCSILLLRWCSRQIVRMKNAFDHFRWFTLHCFRFSLAPCFRLECSMNDWRVYVRQLAPTCGASKHSISHQGHIERKYVTRCIGANVYCVIIINENHWRGSFSFTRYRGKTIRRSNKSREATIRFSRRDTDVVNISFRENTSCSFWFSSKDKYVVW